MAQVPPAATEAVASEGYIVALISGSAAEPMVAAVATLEPHTAAKAAQPPCCNGQSAGTMAYPFVAGIIRVASNSGAKANSPSGEKRQEGRSGRNSCC